MNPQEVLDQIRFTIEDDGRMPDRMSYLTREAAFSAEDASIKLPICEINTIDMEELDVFNTDLARIITDSNGNQIGREYDAEYEMNIDIDILTVAKSSYDREELGDILWQILYPFSDSGPSVDFIDESGNPVEDIWEFRLTERQPVDDFSTTPTLRRWRQTAVVSATDTFTTDDEFIEGYTGQDAPDVQ